LRTAVVHDAGNAVDTTGEDLRRFTRAKELKDHPESGSSFKKRIIELHARFRKVLAENGVRLLSPAPQPEAFCQVFTRDPCFAVGDRLLVGSLRDKYRQAEIAGLSELRKQFTKVTRHLLKPMSERMKQVFGFRSCLSRGRRRRPRI